MNQKTDDNHDEPGTRETEPIVVESSDDLPVEPAVQTDRAPDVKPAPKTRTVTSVVAWLAFLLALLSLACVGYLAWKDRASGATAARSRESVTAVSGQLDEALGSLRDLQERVSGLAASDREKTDEIASLDEQVDELLRNSEAIPARVASLESAISSLQGISTGARDTWLLAEAEYYMQIANAALQLAGNPERARMALGFADERIRQLANPALTEVRRAVSRELRALDAMEKPDIEGMTLTLASLADTVASLPLRREVAAPGRTADDIDAEQSGFARGLASLKRAFSGIVSVRRTDEEVTPLLSPDAAYFLRANLALQLQTARLALLRGEQAIFEQCLRDAADWLEQYYAADSQAVRSAMDTISGLSEGGVSVSLPDISGSLKLLRQFKARGTQEEAVAPAPPEPAQ